MVRANDSKVVVLPSVVLRCGGCAKFSQPQMIKTSSVSAGQGPSLVLSSAWTQLKDGEYLTLSRHMLKRILGVPLWETPAGRRD